MIGVDRFAGGATISLVATMFVALGLIVGRSTSIDPYRTIDSVLIEPMKIQLAPQDSKWLFIYPDEHVEAIVTSGQELDDWIAKVRQSPNDLRSFAYRVLAARDIARTVSCTGPAAVTNQRCNQPIAQLHELRL